MEGEEEYFDAETMLRLKQKGKLIKDVSFIFEDLAKKIEVYRTLGWRGKHFLSVGVRSVYKDFKLGLRKVNSKIPVFVELPTVKSVNEEGMISKTFDGKKDPSYYEINDMKKRLDKPLKSNEILEYGDKSHKFIENKKT